MLQSDIPERGSRVVSSGERSYGWEVMCQEDKSIMRWRGTGALSMSRSFRCVAWTRRGLSVLLVRKQCKLATGFQ